MQMRSASFMRAWPTYSSSVCGRSVASTAFSSSAGCVVTMSSGMVLRQFLQRLADEVLEGRIAVVAGQNLLHHLFRFGCLVDDVGHSSVRVDHDQAGLLG